MTTINPKSAITRRGFLERGAGFLATAGVLADVCGANVARDSNKKVDVAGTNSLQMTGKIALEEHFAMSKTVNASYAAKRAAAFQSQIEEIGSGRIAEMDRGGVELCILSLAAPGIQAIPNVSQATSVARQADDHLA